MPSPKSEAVRAYAEEWSQRLVDDVRAIGVVRDVLAHDISGGVTRTLQGMLALAVTQSFLLATTLTHQEPEWAARGWVDELLEEERSSRLQAASYGPVPVTRAQAARPRLNVQQAIGRLCALAARGDGDDGPRCGGAVELAADQMTPLLPIEEGLAAMRQAAEVRPADQPPLAEALAQWAAFAAFEEGP